MKKKHEWNMGSDQRRSRRSIGALAVLLSLGTSDVCNSGPAAKAAPNPDIPPEVRSLLFGEEPTSPSGPAPRTSEGHPDLSGFWKGSLATTPVGNIGKDLPDFKLPLTPAGAAALPFQIVQNSSGVVFLYMYTYFRLIPTDGRQHDLDPDPAFFGDKIGRWDGDTLVIDTVGLKGSPESPVWIDENANPQSDAMHAIERWTRPDANHLHLELTIDDKKYYTHPFKYARTWLLGKPKEGLHEYSCSENNVDRDHLGPGPGPIKPDGTRGYLVPDLPKVPPSPEFYDKPTNK